MSTQAFVQKTFSSGRQAHQADASAIQNQQVGDRDPQAVEIPPDKQQLIGVKIAEAKVLPLKKTLRTVGRVEFDERKLTTVNVKVEGWVEKLYADYTGKYVTKGEPLAEIYSPELMSTQLEFINLLKWKKEQAHRIQRNIEFQWGDRYGTTTRALSFDLESVILVAKQKLALWEIPEDRGKSTRRGQGAAQNPDSKSSFKRLCLPETCLQRHTGSPW